ncbi:MAG: hypothetical protein KC657_29405 [Myxococcales bacterium]|nr:hypothetical protein [Myxococcales bacterium]
MRRVMGIVGLTAVVACTVQSSSTSSGGSSSGGSSSSGGANVPVSSEPSTADVALCQDQSIVLAGEAGARATARRSSRSFSLGRGFRAESSDGTFVMVAGKEPLSAGGSIFGPALFRAALGGGAPTLNCASAESVVTRDDSATDRVSLRGVSALTECAAGAPVEGSITICSGTRGGELCPKTELTGTLGGVSVNAAFTGYSKSANTFTPSLGRAGYADVALEGDKVTGATFFLTDQADSAVFCATSGTVVSQGAIGPDQETKIELTGIRRLGACPRGGAAVVQGCVK